MTANIIWYATNSSTGKVTKPIPGMPWLTTECSPESPRPPTNPPPTSRPKARLNPTRTHSTLTRPMQKKFCMSMPSTLRVRTMPP